MKFESSLSSREMHQYIYQYNMRKRKSVGVIYYKYSVMYMQRSQEILIAICKEWDEGGPHIVNSVSSTTLS